MKNPLPPLTHVEAYERACGLKNHQYRSFGEVESKRIILGLLDCIDALTEEVKANAMREAA